MSDTPAFSDRRIRVSRVADQVADSVRELIISGALQDGERLPRVELLLKEFGVSEPSMREAFRILEKEGLISVQRGAAGGTFVRRPDAKTAAYLVALVLSSEGTQMGDLINATTVLEPVCAMLCAQRHDRMTAVVPELRQLNLDARRLVDEDKALFSRNMMLFHDTLVQRCGNDAVKLLVGILETIWLAKMRQIEAQPFVEDSLQEREAMARHESICDLIAAGEDFQVHKVMTEHLNVVRLHNLDFGQEGGINRNERVNASSIRNIL